MHSEATPLVLDHCTFDANLMEASNSTVAVVSAGSAAAPVMLRDTILGQSSSLNLRSQGGAVIYSDDSSLQYAPCMLLFCCN